MKRSIFKIPERVTMPWLMPLLALMVFIPLHSQYALGKDGAALKKPVKLVFIHHSCGENWLADDNGRLGLELAKNGYFVSDTNYGWGPDSIGDRTDITDWPEWFVSENSSRYLKALYGESGRHSNYTRTLGDPGGHNRIVMFKSCFPNSNLRGSPGDRPSRGEGLSVANAKAIYNELLGYFKKRPDKLFVAVTAPPVLDRTHSANARAFNNWLVREWLSGYKGGNVAVFDFYNVLTGPDSHHRFINGNIEHTTGRGSNTLYYPTGDDEHPSRAGNLRATGEFIPLLNHYYDRWAENVPSGMPPGQEASEPRGESSGEKAQPAASAEKKEKEGPEGEDGTAEPGSLIDDFENPDLQWVVFKDEGKDTRLVISRDESVSHNSKVGLRIDYDIAPESWATCSLVYAGERDVRNTRGIELFLHTENSGRSVTVVAYQGKASDGLSHFEFRAQPGKESERGWQRIRIQWKQFVQPPWEGDGTALFDPEKAKGIAFAFVSNDNSRNRGRIWVDDIRFLNSGP